MKLQEMNLGGPTQDRPEGRRWCLGLGKQPESGVSGCGLAKAGCGTSCLLLNFSSSMAGLESVRLTAPVLAWCALSRRRSAARCSRACSACGEKAGKDRRSVGGSSGRAPSFSATPNSRQVTAASLLINCELVPFGPSRVCRKAYWEWVRAVVLMEKNDTLTSASKRKNTAQ